MLAGLAFFFLLYFVTTVFQTTLCPIKNLFGFSCFGCGLTRGFIAIPRLDFKGALHHHVLSIPLFVGIAVYAVLCFTDILFNRNDLERISKLGRHPYMLILYMAILASSAFISRAL
ncbi:MAG: DUF2752 domain-containing protein [Clostridia bacterium]|nr:DUF2752 domain-containing protein [Clostridia bacterium]